MKEMTRKPIVMISFLPSGKKMKMLNRGPWKMMSETVGILGRWAPCFPLFFSIAPFCLLHIFAEHCLESFFYILLLAEVLYVWRLTALWN